jgi:hypothetical protein
LRIRAPLIACLAAASSLLIAAAMITRRARRVTTIASTRRLASSGSAELPPTDPQQGTTSNNQQGLLSNALLAVQLNSYIVLVLIASEWVFWSGYFGYFAITLSETGLTSFDLIVFGVSDYLPVVVLFAYLVVLQRLRLQRPGPWYWVVLGMSLTAAVVGSFITLVPKGSLSSLLSAYILYTIILVYVIASATVQRTKVRIRIAICLLIIGATFGALLSYHQGQFIAEKMTQLHPLGGSVPRRILFSISGFPSRFVELVRVHGVEDTPSDCGVLLGMSDKQIILYYPEHYHSEQQFPDAPGVRNIWRLPTDNATLEHC